MAKDTSASYDTLVELLESIERFLRRLDICTQVSHTLALDETVLKIMVELLSTLALVTKELRRGRSREYVPVDVLLFSVQVCNTARFVKKPFEGKDVEAVLQRLDRLTQDEARATATEILKVVYGLVQNMNVVMEGGQMCSLWFTFTVC